MPRRAALFSFRVTFAALLGLIQGSGFCLWLHVSIPMGGFADVDARIHFQKF